MFSKEYVAGISVSDGVAQVAVLEVRSGGVRLRHLAEVTKSSDSPHWYLDTMLTRSEKVYRKVRKVSVALANSAVLLYGFPMDTTLTQIEQNQHIDWELEHFISGYKPRDYVKDIHVLATRAQEHTSDMLVIAARRSYVVDVQQMLQEKKFSLHIADIDHFGAQYALAVNYPEAREKCVAVIAVAPARVDLGVLDHDRLIHYRHAQLSTEREIIDLLDHELAERPLTNLFFCGIGATPSLVNEAKQRLKIQSSLLNPTRQLRISRSFRTFEEFAGREFRFASAIGCALRKQ